MSSLLVLALPDFLATFAIDTYPFGFVIGVVLLQKGHPLAFFSCKLCPRMCLASVYVKDMFNVTKDVKKW